MSVGVTVGAGDIAAKLKEQLERLRQAAAQGVFAAANNVMTTAKDNIPVAFGVAKGSGYVTAPIVSGDLVAVEAGFGGPAQDYVAIIHERTEIRYASKDDDGRHVHDSSGNVVMVSTGRKVSHEVGGPKFLERAVDAEQQDVKAVVADFIQSALKGGEDVATKTHPATPDEGPSETAITKEKTRREKVRAKARAKKKRMKKKGA